MNLESILKLLSKSSPYSVSTLSKSRDEFYLIKQYLYEKSPIEIDFNDALLRASRGTINFLCGSSGDGKSEILTRCAEHYSDTDFHLDATHSASQHTSAVASLNEAFTKHKKNNTKMAVGINIGMMQKFIKYGSNEHSDIKNSMCLFFENRHVKGYSHDKFTFYDFESYPRLNFKNNEITSEFTSAFLTKLTMQNSANPFWTAYEQSNKETQVSKNFLLLGRDSFKKQLINLFGLAKLYKEQFLTPRTLIDYIYQILTFENQAIYNNVFTLFDNDLSKKIYCYDPVLSDGIRIDDFKLKYSLGLLDNSLNNDIQKLEEKYGKLNSSDEVLRLVYFIKDDIKDVELYKFLKEAYQNNILLDYLELYNLTRQHTLSHEQLDKIEDIIYSNVIKGIRLFSNRIWPQFNDDYLLIRKIQENYVGVKAQIEIDLDNILQKNISQSDGISIDLIINDEEVYQLDLDINLFDLLVRIVNGYYPNVQKKTNVLILEDIVEKILEKSSNSKKIVIHNREHFLTIENKERKYVVEYS